MVLWLENLCQPGGGNVHWTDWMLRQRTILKIPFTCMYEYFEDLQRDYSLTACSIAMVPSPTSTGCSSCFLCFYLVGVHAWAMFEAKGCRKLPKAPEFWTFQQNDGKISRYYSAHICVNHKEGNATIFTAARHLHVRLFFTLLISYLKPNHQQEQQRLQQSKSSVGYQVSSLKATLAACNSCFD